MSDLLELVMGSMQQGTLPNTPLTNEQLRHLYVAATEKKKREVEERKQRQIREYVKQMCGEIVREAMRGKIDLTFQGSHDLDMLGKHKDDVFAQLREAFPEILLSEDYRHPQDRTRLTGLYVKWA